MNQQELDDLEIKMIGFREAMLLKRWEQAVEEIAKSLEQMKVGLGPSTSCPLARGGVPMASYEDHLVQRRDHGEYQEGPERRLSLFTLTCECGRIFDCVDADAKECPTCLFQRLSPRHLR